MTTAVADALRADAFAPDAVYAYWDGSGDETASREIARGRQPIAAVLARWAEVKTLVSVSDGRDCFIEGCVGDTATFVAALQLDDAGTDRALPVVSRSAGRAAGRRRPCPPRTTREPSWTATS